MSGATLIIGDVRDALRSLPEGSVDLVMTSPPFLALRSYLPEDHPDKALEIGSEATPGEFLDALLDVTEELARVLAPHGSICVELGDTYSGSGGAGGDYGAGGLRDGQQRFNGAAAKARSHAPKERTRSAVTGWPLDKSLCLIPELYRFALTYGFNPLTERETDPWRIRNVVRWVRPNPPVGALADKFRPATSEMVVATKSRTRFFDLDAAKQTEPDRTFRKDKDSVRSDGWGRAAEGMQQNPAGAPPLDWWEIPTQPYKGSHYATFPEALCVRPIKAMCPERVCLVCGEPSRRIVDEFTLDSYRGSTRPQTQRAVALADAAGLTDAHIAAIRAFGTSDAGKAAVINNGAGKNSAEVKRLAADAKEALGGYFREFVMSTNAERTSGWSDCGHDAWRAGRVLDPFAGSGTTLAVAVGHGRQAIGIDLDERNADLARERVGMFLTVEHLDRGAA